MCSETARLRITLQYNTSHGTAARHRRSHSTRIPRSGHEGVYDIYGFFAGHAGGVVMRINFSTWRSGAGYTRRTGSSYGFLGRLIRIGVAARRQAVEADRVTSGVYSGIVFRRWLKSGGIDGRRSSERRRTPAELLPAACLGYHGFDYNLLCFLSEAWRFQSASVERAESFVGTANCARRNSRARQRKRIEGHPGVEATRSPDPDSTVETAS